MQRKTLFIQNTTIQSKINFFVQEIDNKKIQTLKINPRSVRNLLHWNLNQNGKNYCHQTKMHVSPLQIENVGIQNLSKTWN